MRQLLSILLVVSLSWVTTSTVCRMDGLGSALNPCHCPHTHKLTAQESEKPASVAADEDCCDTVASAALDDHQPGITTIHPTLDLPALVLLPAKAWIAATPVARLLGTPPPVRGPPSRGTRTYLNTARLRI